MDGVAGPERGCVFQAVAPVADEIAGEDGEEAHEPHRQRRPLRGLHKNDAGTLDGEARRAQQQHEQRRDENDVEHEEREIGAHLVGGRSGAAQCFGAARRKSHEREHDSRPEQAAECGIERDPRIDDEVRHALILTRKARLR